jgi:hypothetical protein
MEPGSQQSLGHTKWVLATLFCPVAAGLAVEGAVRLVVGDAGSRESVPPGETSGMPPRFLREGRKWVLLTQAVRL